MFSSCHVGQIKRWKLKLLISKNWYIFTNKCLRIFKCITKFLKSHVLLSFFLSGPDFRKRSNGNRESNLCTFPSWQEIVCSSSSGSAWTQRLAFDRHIVGLHKQRWTIIRKNVWGKNFLQRYRLFLFAALLYILHRVWYRTTKECWKVFDYKINSVLWSFG